VEAIGGLEIIPPRPPGEMDLDAVLARRPAVVLVDDFGQHHQAITALRDAGIDVLSTVDVYDLERAADTVEEMTGQPAAATVSDAALAEADDIRFVDSSPEALRKRLGHGNIYPAAQAEAALAGLFAAANLARLREIGLQVVAETLTASLATPPREPPGVLVGITAPDQADTLVQRGIRLARPTGATCTVLLPRLPADVASVLRQAAEDVGARVIGDEGSDAATAITQAARQTGARHVVGPAGTTARRGRWLPSLTGRPSSLAELLADELPDVHLHITPARARLIHDERPGGAGRADGAADGGQPRRRGAVRVYLGYTAGCGVTTAMLDEARRRRSRGADVVVAVVDCRDREAVSAALDGLELIGGGTTLDTGAVLARRPEVACVDDLSKTDPGTGETRLDAARRLAEAGITVVATVQLGSMRGDGGAAGGPRLDEAAVLAFADELELVDAPPAVLAGRARRGELGPAAAAEGALRTSYAPEALAAQREQAFSIAAEHADRRLAAYRRGGIAASSQAPPVILACAAPEPGMEPLIRSAAAQAARLAGRFMVAVIAPVPPAPGLEAVLAGYEALAGQLGGQFVVRPGTPAATLTALADENQVTEMFLARRTPARAGHHPVLRELARAPGRAEVHVLPAEAGRGLAQRAGASGG
jgi:K+-sensing histidine kinase KdpD